MTTKQIISDIRRYELEIQQIEVDLQDRDFVQHLDYNARRWDMLSNHVARLREALNDRIKKGGKP